MIAILRRANDTYALANIDIGLIATVAKDAPTGYVHPYRCRACHANICRLCTAAMEANGWTCPGPLEKQIELARSGLEHKSPWNYGWNPDGSVNFGGDVF